MSTPIDRRAFLGTGVAASAAAAAPASRKNKRAAAGKAKMPMGTIAGMEISRLLLGGNLLTHYTHSRDLKYVYKLTANYNTDKKILDTLAKAETHGINTLVIHTVPRALAVLKEHRRRGGKMKWIICTTAPLAKGLAAYGRSIRQLVDDGTDAIYVWGVRGDAMCAKKSKAQMDLIAEAVRMAKDMKVPSGVGGHDLNVVVQCEKHNVPCDFYVKTFHHHKYPTAPKPEELKGPYSEIPGYWCKDPQATIDVMAKVTKPWIAFKVMAAGAIPPANAFNYVLKNGADHVLAGMFDFEIAPDAELARNAVAAAAKRSRPWCS